MKFNRKYTRLINLDSDNLINITDKGRVDADYNFIKLLVKANGLRTNKNRKIHKRFKKILEHLIENYMDLSISK